MRTLPFGISGIIAATVAGCVDPEPGTFIPKDAGMTIDVERPMDVASDIDPKELCMSCIRAPEDPGPGCKTLYDTCFADPLCWQILLCAEERDCLSKQTSNAVLACGTPCALEAGLFDATSPTAKAIGAIIGCVTQPQACLPYCGAP